MALRTTREVSLLDRTVLFWKRTGWIISLSVLTLVLYFPTLQLLVQDWWDLEDYSYCFLVPVVVGYVLRQERSRYRAVIQNPSNLGLVVMVLAIALLVVGTLGADLFIPRMSLPLLLAGIVVYVFGWSMLRAVAFPLCYLTLMVPLPGIVHNQITFPLQLLASRIAENIIAFGSVPVVREGNLLRVPFFSVEVAQACSGIRSLLSLIALGVAFVYFAERRTILRVVVVALMLPIAVFTNAIRIVVVCLLGYKIGPKWAEGFMHLFSGWLIFVIAVVLLFVCHAVLRRLLTRVEKIGKAPSNA